MSYVSQIPCCTNQKTDEDLPCGIPMFRIGIESNFALVCPLCDGGVGPQPPNYDPASSLDAPK